MTFNHRLIMRTISVILLFEGIAMLPPLVCAVIYKETDVASAFTFVSLFCITFGLVVYKFLKYETLNIKTREGYFVVCVSWILVCLVGSLPYMFSLNGYSFIDCIFESVAGWTTTGAHILDIAVLPKSLILWKTICNWLGGMGIIILTISIFPILGIGGQKMAAAEVPGPELEKFYARIGDSAKVSYEIYAVLTILELLLLLPSEMGTYDAIVNTLSSISTAGIISVNGSSVAQFTPYVKTVITIFSFVGAINFSVYFFISIKKWRGVYRNVELRTFISLITLGTIIMTIMLRLTNVYTSIWSALGNAATQAISFSSTSGFTTSDIGEWPTTCKMILLILVLIGGCAVSTSGSIKVIRFVVFLKLIVRGIYKRIHPKAIKPIIVIKKPVSAESASSITVFLILFFGIYITSSILMGIENKDMETTLSATLAAFTNNGTGFGLMTNGDFSIFSWFGKIIASILMLAGRLEMYAIVVLFSKSYWNSDRARS